MRIILTTSAMNGLEVMGSDVQNAFLTALCKEKIWLIAGSEFGNEQGKKFLVVRDLYGLKSASAEFQAYMADKLDEMGFKSSVADLEVWMMPAVKPDREEYYEYILMYVDDILAISMQPRDVMKDIKQIFKFNNNKVEELSSYLGSLL